MNTELRKEMKKRYKSLKKAQKNRDQKSLKDDYRKKRNKVTKLLRRAETDYWKVKIEGAVNASGFWKVIKEFQGKSKSQIGAIVDEENRFLTENKGKAECLNKFFPTVGENLIKEINSDPDFNQLSHIYRITPTLDRIDVNEERTIKAVRKYIKSGKSCGPDRIQARDVKLAGTAVLEGINIVIKACSEKSKVPSQWKISKGKSLSKSGAKMERGNYSYRCCPSLAKF